MYTCWLALFFFCSLSAAAAIKTVVANNSTGWTYGTNWSPTGVPATGDVVLIPSGQTISVKGNIYAVPPSLNIRVSGSLDFEPSGKLDLAASSTLQVLEGGQSTSHNINSEVIWIGGVTKYQGGIDASPLAGPLYASSSTGVSPTGFIYAVVLPLRLETFTAQMRGQKVVVQWTIAEAVNLSHFTVEKTEDGNRWRSIATIQQKGAKKNYEAIDPAKNNGSVFYRLKTTDLDGTTSFSPVARVHVQTVGVLVAPNPVSQKIKLTVTENIPVAIHLQLLDFSGRVVAETDAMPVSGKAEMEVHLLRKSWYSIRVGHQGTVISRQKIRII